MTKVKVPRVEIADSLVREIEAHCFSVVSTEVGGFLLGTIQKEKTQISAVIPSSKAQSQQTALTFTHDAWDECYQIMSSDYPELELVGWYHSHPGFGIFMSDYDQFIQQNFFGSPGHVGFVVDPLAGKSGWFFWNGSTVSSFRKGTTLREGLGGEASDHLVPEPSGAVLRQVSPQAVALGVVGCVVAALSGFFLGQRQGPDVGVLRQQINLLAADNQSFILSASAPLFETARDGESKQTKFFVRYRLTDVDKNAGFWVEYLTARFGVSEAALQKANPQLDLTGLPPESVLVPVFGWSRVPKLVPEPTPPPASSAETPAPKITTPEPTGKQK